VLPLLAVFNQCDAVVTLCFGVFRGAGMQAHGAALNLFTQYVVALPLAWLLGLHWQGGVAGLWLGPTIAKATAAVLGAIIVTRMDWDELSRLAVARASEEHHQ
jgi:MATE family multidrug resistance protein